LIPHPSLLPEGEGTIFVFLSGVRKMYLSLNKLFGNGKFSLFCAPQITKKRKQPPVVHSCFEIII
jgi:hypothetical protein